MSGHEGIREDVTLVRGAHCLMPVCLTKTSHPGRPSWREKAPQSSKWC